MSKFTADEVYALAVERARSGDSEAAHALHAFVHRLRQEEEENRRDPVKEPKTGDILTAPNGFAWIYHGDDWIVAKEDAWVRLCQIKGATIMRRREAQQ